MRLTKLIALGRVARDAYYLEHAANGQLNVLQNGQAPQSVRFAEWIDTVKPASPLVIDGASLQKIPDELQFRLADTGQLHVDLFERVLPIRQLSTVGRRQLFVEVRPGLLAPLDGALPAALPTLYQAIPRERMQVVSFFNPADVDAARQLARSSGERFVHYTRVLDGKGILPAYREKILLLVGHIEGSAFQVASPDGLVAQHIPIQELVQAARELRTTVLFVGCESYSASANSGFTKPVWIDEVAVSLERAMHADSYADLLGSLGSADNPFVITGAALEHEAARATIEASRWHANAPVARVASSEPAASSCEPAASSCEPAASSCEPAASSCEPAASSCEPAASSCEPAASSCEPAASSSGPNDVRLELQLAAPKDPRQVWRGLLYCIVGAGALGSLLAHRSAWGAFSRHFPLLPAPGCRRLVHATTWTVRALLFCCAAPVVSALVGLWLLNVGVGGPAKSYDVVWRIILAPINLLTTSCQFIAKGWVS